MLSEWLFFIAISVIFLFVIDTFLVSCPRYYCENHLRLLHSSLSHYRTQEIWGQRSQNTHDFHPQQKLDTAPEFKTRGRAGNVWRRFITAQKVAWKYHQQREILSVCFCPTLSTRRSEGNPVVIMRPPKDTLPTTAPQPCPGLSFPWHNRSLPSSERRLLPQGRCQEKMISKWMLLF